MLDDRAVEQQAVEKVELPPHSAPQSIKADTRQSDDLEAIAVGLRLMQPGVAMQDGLGGVWPRAKADELDALTSSLFESARSFSSPSINRSIIGFPLNSHTNFGACLIQDNDVPLTSVAFERLVAWAKRWGASWHREFLARVAR